MRMWLGLGVAALAVVLCCGGGTLALIGLGISATQAINEQARAVVGDYFDALRRDDFAEAYDLLCTDLQRRESPREFQRRQTAEPEITAVQIGTVSIADELVVPVDVTYVGGRQDNLHVRLEQESDGGLSICGVS